MYQRLSKCIDGMSAFQRVRLEGFHCTFTCSELHTATAMVNMYIQNHVCKYIVHGNSLNIQS